MKKLLSVFVLSLLLTTTGCESGLIQQILSDSTPRLVQEPEPPRQAQYQTIGEEVPPACILGTTYNRGEIKPTSKYGQISTGLQWIWGIVRDAIGK
jgi:hypothetical protein